jgi:hypothetical protein
LEGVLASSVSSGAGVVLPSAALGEVIAAAASSVGF